MATARNIGVLAPLEHRLRMRGLVHKMIDLDDRRDVLNTKTVHFRSNDQLNLVTVQMLRRSVRTVLCLCLLVNESPVLLLALFTSQILSFYRNLMSALPPPPVSPHWQRVKLICALVRPHCRLRTGTALEPRSEKAIKSYSVCLNWSLDPLLLRGGWLGWKMVLWADLRTVCFHIDFKETVTCARHCLQPPKRI